MGSCSSVHFYFIVSRRLDSLSRRRSCLSVLGRSDLGFQMVYLILWAKNQPSVTPPGSPRRGSNPLQQFISRGRFPFTPVSFMPLGFCFGWGRRAWDRLDRLRAKFSAFDNGPSRFGVRGNCSIRRSGSACQAELCEFEVSLDYMSSRTVSVT